MVDMLQERIRQLRLMGESAKRRSNIYSGITDLDDKMNYYVMGGGKKGYFLINEYKTSGKYGTLIIPIRTKALDEAIKMYVKKLGENEEYLFLTLLMYHLHLHLIQTFVEN